MNYVLVAVIAAPGYLLAAVLAFVLSRQGRDREAVEARLHTERDDALLRNGKLAEDNMFLLAELVKLRTENANYEVRIVELNEEIKALTARNTGLSEALADAQAENKQLQKRTELISAENENFAQMIRNSQPKRTTKKVVSE